MTRSILRPPSSVHVWTVQVLKVVRGLVDPPLTRFDVCKPGGAEFLRMAHEHVHHDAAADQHPITAGFSSSPAHNRHDRLAYVPRSIGKSSFWSPPRRRLAVPWHVEAMTPEPQR